MGEVLSKRHCTENNKTSKKRQVLKPVFFVFLRIAASYYFSRHTYIITYKIFITSFSFFYLIVLSFSRFQTALGG